MAYLFDENDFKKCDEMAKNKVIELMSSHPLYSKYTLISPRNKFTVDLYVYEGDKHVANVEVEVKRVWDTLEFPFTDVQIPVRKKKFWELREHNLRKPTMYVMFNEDCTNHLVITDAKMQKCFEDNITREHNTHASRSEFFYITPMSSAKFGLLNALAEK